ncbi:MAG TPA: hypothetical protein VII29_18085, partial [Terriglobales bacterium]
MTILSTLLCLRVAAQQTIDTGDASLPPPAPFASTLTEKLPHPNEKYFIGPLVLWKRENELSIGRPVTPSNSG